MLEGLREYAEGKIQKETLEAVNIGLQRGIRLLIQP